MARQFVLLQRRCMSTSEVSSQLAKTPIQVFGIDGRYATALYSAAVKQKKLEAVESEVKSVQKLIHEDARFRDFVVNPTLKRRTKRDAIEAVAKKLSYSSISTNFFTTIADNGRMARLEGILRSFEQLMSAHRGEVQCEITTAKPLDTAAEKELNNALEAFIKPGQKLHIKTKVDPSIIGGMVATVGDKYVDMSMATKIQTYANAIQQAI